MGKSKKINKGGSGQNRKASDAFLEKYRNKPGVISTESGLLYSIVDEGAGMSPMMADSVVVNQRILNVTGKIIADTYQSGMPDQFSLKEAIAGMQEGLQLMKEGARYEFVVPPELAWGKRGVGDKIGPNAVLIMDVRLVEVLIQ